MSKRGSLLSLSLSFRSVQISVRVEYEPRHRTNVYKYPCRSLVMTNQLHSYFHCPAMFKSLLVVCLIIAVVGGNVVPDWRTEAMIFPCGDTRNQHRGEGVSDWAFDRGTNEPLFG